MTVKTWALMTVCLLPCVATGADSTSFGDWQVGITDDNASVFAGTVNDSGSVLAETCATDKDSCFWILTTDSACREDAEYPVLVNSDQSAAAAVVTCLGAAESKGAYRYRFNDWKGLEAVILNASKVGFAFPLQQDPFTVVRFSDEVGRHASRHAVAGPWDRRAISAGRWFRETSPVLPRTRRLRGASGHQRVGARVHRADPA